MTIQLTNAGKRFNRDWIFKRFNYTFVSGQRYAITGHNGSGKSTLLQAIAGSMELSEGELVYEHNGKVIPQEKVYSMLSMAAPYIDVIEEMTAREFLTFHSRFKPFINISIEEIIATIDLHKAADKQIRYFSSGMKQRIKLAQAIFCQSPLLLLDEPCTNLDSVGFELYHQLIQQFAAQKTIIVSSNDANEYDFCQHIISINDYK